MFEKIRKPGRAKSLFSYVIFGLICLVFVFIGVPMGQLSDIGGAALVVNNRVISWSEYQRYLDILENQSQETSSTGLEAERQKQLRQRALEDLLNIELVVQEAQNIKELVAAKAIQEKIVETSAFQEEGRFKHSQYHAFLEARRMTPSHFEGLIAKDLQSFKFQKLFDFSIATTEIEKQKKEELVGFDIVVSYLSFSGAELTQEELEELRTSIGVNSSDSLANMIKSKKWSWEQTQSFNLASTSLPGLESKKILFDEVLNHIPQTGLIPKVIGVQDKFFILRVDLFAQKTIQEKPEDITFFTDKMSSRMAFLAWMRFARAHARLKINPRLQENLRY